MIDSNDNDGSTRLDATAKPLRDDTPSRREPADAALADVVITDELARRASRAPDYHTENLALHSLTQQMAERPEHLLNNLVSTALVQCRASTAGVSVLETSTSGEAIFRWAAIAGTFEHHVDTTTAAATSACGLCLERQSAQLFAEPGRYFASFADAQPAVCEALILPFPQGSGHRGTIWVMTHDSERAFDSEDVRLLTALANFTTAALRHADAVKSQQARQNRETRLAGELKALNDLHQLTNRLLTATDFESALDDLLATTLELHDTDMGTLQIHDPKLGELAPVVHRGFENAGAAIPTIRAEDASSCALALESGARVIVEDYETNAATMAHRALAASLGYRAAQSTPLMTREGELLGMLTTHFHEPHRPSDHALRMTDLYARQASQLLERHRAQAALHEADRRKNEFLAVLSHELRDPLAPIRNTLQVLKREDTDRSAVRAMIEMLERQVGQMVRLVDDLLDVSRITRGRIELRRERIALVDIVQRAEEAAGLQCRDKGVQLTITPAAQPLYINGDAVRLTQILGNLLGNACKFTDEGGHITLRVERAGEQAVIRVQDTGIGIAAESFPHIFEMFGQVDAARQRSQGGLGIGLTLAKELAELHDGTIEVVSDGAGKGSEFVLRLPLAAEPERASPVPPEAPAQASHRILVVDDNPDSTESLSLLLGLIGHDVRTAPDGPQALEAAAAFRPDLVLLDIGLPGMDGPEVCRRIRSQPWGRATIVAALTGWGGEEDRDRSVEAGFDAHLVKPVDDATLMQLLASLSEGAAAD